MPNGAYGRFVPRMALAVAQYRAMLGEWPTHARGEMLRVLLSEPGEGSDRDDFSEFSRERASAIKARLSCDWEHTRYLIELTGPSGSSSGYGLVAWETREAGEAYWWLYGEEPPWMWDVGTDEQDGS